MNVGEKVREIRRRIELATASSAATSGSHERRREELTTLNASYTNLYRMRNATGEMPPIPNTARGRVGSYLVRIVQRMLFWYTPQIVRFHNETVRALDSVCHLLEFDLEESAVNREQIRKVRGELSRLRDESSRTIGHPIQSGPPEAGLLPVAGGAWMRSFQFAVQDKFRGSGAEIGEKLRTYLQTIRRAAIPQGPWLDAGCGRGEWLEIARSAGHCVRGVDFNPASVSYCQAKGLDAVEQDAVEHLCGLAAESLAVLTAFHFVEHCTIEYLMAFMREAARALMPGGLLICETPDPANLVMGSHRFWYDPTHQRPLPMALLEFMFDYVGLTVIERLRLNPAPQEEQLPFAEIELVRRLNEHLYGPQDYGIVGRR